MHITYQPELSIRTVNGGKISALKYRLHTMYAIKFFNEFCKRIIIKTEEPRTRSTTLATNLLERVQPALETSEPALRILLSASFLTL